MTKRKEKFLVIMQGIERVLERIRAYMDNKLKPRSEKMQWLADIYANIPIDKIIDYISKVYGV